jgi:chemotaxis protein histidine kinase CheA
MFSSPINSLSDSFNKLHCNSCLGNKSLLIFSSLVAVALINLIFKRIVTNYVAAETRQSNEQIQKIREQHTKEVEQLNAKIAALELLGTNSSTNLEEKKEQLSSGLAQAEEHVEELEGAHAQAFNVKEPQYTKEKHAQLVKENETLAIELHNLKSSTQNQSDRLQDMEALLTKTDTKCKSLEAALDQLRSTKHPSEEANHKKITRLESTNKELAEELQTLSEELEKAQADLRKAHQLVEQLQENATEEAAESFLEEGLSFDDEGWNATITRLRDGCGLFIDTCHETFTMIMEAVDKEQSNTLGQYIKPNVQRLQALLEEFRPVPPFPEGFQHHSEITHTPLENFS